MKQTKIITCYCDESMFIDVTYPNGDNFSVKMTDEQSEVYCAMSEYQDVCESQMDVICAWVSANYAENGDLMFFDLEEIASDCISGTELINHLSLHLISIN